MISATETIEDLKRAERPAVRTAEPLPPLAMPADVYLTKLEALVLENSDLRAQIGRIVGRALGVLEGISATVSAGNELDNDYLNEAVDPVIQWLRTLL